MDIDEPEGWKKNRSESEVRKGFKMMNLYHLLKHTS